jgi:hypothetical protein
MILWMGRLSRRSYDSAPRPSPPTPSNYERAILLRFLGIILRDFRLEVSVCIIRPQREGHVFLSGFSSVSFTVYRNIKVRGCASFKNYKSHGKAVEETVNSKEVRLLSGFRPGNRPLN